MQLLLLGMESSLFTMKGDLPFQTRRKVRDESFRLASRLLSCGSNGPWLQTTKAQGIALGCLRKAQSCGR
jgi:hypothetical protein